MTRRPVSTLEPSRIVNLLDLVIIGIIVVSIAAGFWRGFVVGAYEILIAIGGLLIAALFYDNAAGVLDAVFDWREPVRNLIGFVGVYLLVQVPAFLFLQPAVRRFRRVTGFVPGTRMIDRVAGLGPGLVQGILIASVVTLAMGLFPTSSFLGQQLSDSAVGLRLYRNATGTALRAASAVGFEFSDFYTLMPGRGEKAYVLPFEIPAESLSVSTSDEEAMLELVNEERVKAGLQPLQLDPALVAVARAHSAEMFEEGYFSHESPITGSPYDRLAAAGVGYQFAGENLALAPNVETAHEGLMDSPGHRENILDPDYRYIGIGAISSDRHGTMYTQMFRG